MILVDACFIRFCKDDQTEECIETTAVQTICVSKRILRSMAPRVAATLSPIRIRTVAGLLARFAPFSMLWTQRLTPELVGVTAAALRAAISPIIRFCPNLQFLTLMMEPMSGSADLFAGLRGLNMLRSLELDTSDDVTAASLMPLQELPRLETLTFSFCTVDDSEAVLKNIALIPSLTALELKVVGGELSDRGFAALCGRRGERMRRLVLSRAPGSFLAPIAETMPRLEHLSLHSCTLPDRDLAKLLAQCKCLTDLDLCWCKCVASEEGDYDGDDYFQPFRAIPRSSSLLRTIDISFCDDDAFDDSAFEAFGTIRTLEVLHCNHSAITDDGFLALSAAGPAAKSLRELHMPSCLSVRSSWVTALARFSYLRVLNIEDATSLSSLAFLAAMPHLEDLCVDKCGDLTDASIAAGIVRVPLLCHLNVSCTAAGFATLRACVRALPRLHDLRISGAEALELSAKTAAGREALALLAAMPALRELAATIEWGQRDRVLKEICSKHRKSTDAFQLF